MCRNVIQYLKGKKKQWIEHRSSNQNNNIQVKTNMYMNETETNICFANLLLRKFVFLSLSQSFIECIIIYSNWSNDLRLNNVIKNADIW